MSSAEDIVAHVQNHITANSAHWHTREFTTSSLGKTISAIHFVADPNERNEGAGDVPPTNHWSIYLQLNEDSSVRLEVIPLDVSAPGVVVLTDKPYGVEKNVACVVTASVPETTTIAHILKPIVDKRRDRYQFDAVGQGCRMWALTLAADLVEADVLDAQSNKELSDAISLYWPYPLGTAPYSRVLDQGVFF
ncbi:hypothetical protein EV121DRAFT_200890 [Schizophyllum commune]